MSVSIQPAGPGTTVTCPACGHQDEYPGDASLEVVTCDQCRSRLAYGVLTPRWTHLPAIDPRFLRVRIAGTIEILLDRDYARAIALDALSVCPPPAKPEAPKPLTRAERLLEEIVEGKTPKATEPQASKDDPR